MNRRRVALAAGSSALLLLLLVPLVGGHGVGDDDAAFLAGNEGLNVGPFMYLGAKHMVTGYDHLLFLVGVIFFLYKPRDIGIYVSLFTLGHSVTLLVGVLADVPANSYLVDAVIGASVVYKGFDNLGGWQKLFGKQPDSRKAVLLFGLVHGFGLATKVQDLGLSEKGLVGNLLAFNVGVELGQATALAAILLAITYWRRSPTYLRFATVTNALLMLGGFLLVGFQLGGYFS
ncbi:MAG: HupE/UreJ family protein [Thermoplasmatota archaeon]